MNPLKLLTSGRTFRNLKDKGDYKPAPKGAFPKFEPSKRSIPASPAVQAEKMPEQSSLFSQPKTAETLAATIEALKAAPAAPVAGRFGGYWKSLIQRVIFGRKPRRTTGVTVQAELALEQVKVVRNDLSEDDLEVVMVERKVGTGDPSANALKRETGGAAWTKLAGRFSKRKPEPAPAMAEREP